MRIREDSRAERDERVEALRKKYAPKRAALEERLRRAQQAESRESGQVTQRGVQAAISIGATILGAVLGRKTISATNIGRATTAARDAGRVLKEREDVTRAQETVARRPAGAGRARDGAPGRGDRHRGAGRGGAARGRGHPAEEDRRARAPLRARAGRPTGATAAAQVTPAWT